MTNQSALLLRLASLLLLLLVYSTDAKMNIVINKQDFLVGEEILVVCKAGGEGDITWQKDGEDVDEDLVVKVDETTSKMIIKKATMEDAGRYICHCDFDNGHSDDVSTTLFIYEGPSFGSTTVYHEFLEGGDGIVPCLVTGQPSVTVKWLKDGKEISPNEILPDNALSLRDVRRQDAGTYTCQAQITGRPVTKLLSVSVVVNAPPTVRLREEVKKVLAGPENNVSLLCLVDGQPKPNINWTVPGTFDPSRHHFNSDHSELIIQSVTRDDFGEYMCTATNKIAESSATITLHVYEGPAVFVSAQRLTVYVGEKVSVSCNVSGHPQPELHWLNKHNGQTLDSSTGRVYVDNGTLVIEEMMPSDGGLYSCMAVGLTGNASRDVAIYTQPGKPHYLTVFPGLTSVHFSLKTLPNTGGTRITSFILQWRQSAAEKWKEITVSASDPLAIASLRQCTLYTVRLAAMNEVGLGEFSDVNTVRTLGLREPDSPVLLSDDMTVEGNSFSVPLKLADDGGSPLQGFNIRYRQDKDGSEWKEMQLPPNADSISLEGLSFSSGYQVEVTAINANGSSEPAAFNFTIAERPASSRMTKGSVIGIVMVIFLVVFLAVDASCCYRNRCGLLMSIGVKLFGQKVPGLKMLDDGEGATNGEVRLKGISTPRGSMQHSGVQTLSKEVGQLTEVTCDKAPLTRHEKQQPGRELPTCPDP